MWGGGGFFIVNSTGRSCSLPTSPPEVTPPENRPASRFWKLLPVLALTLSRAPASCSFLPSPFILPTGLNSLCLTCPLVSQQQHSICSCWNTQCLGSALPSAGRMSETRMRKRGSHQRRLSKKMDSLKALATANWRQRVSPWTECAV